MTKLTSIPYKLKSINSDGQHLIVVISLSWIPSKLSWAEDKNGLKIPIIPNIKVLLITINYGRCKGIWLDNKNLEEKQTIKIKIIVCHTPKKVAQMFIVISIL